MTDQYAIYQSAASRRDADAPCGFPGLGAYADDVTRWAREILPHDSFLNWQGDAGSWQSHGRAIVRRMLGREPALAPIEAETISVVEHEGVRIEKLRYQLWYGPPTEGLFLAPMGANGPLPGVLGLHDHGAFKYYGKEKIVEQPDDVSRPRVREFRDRIYGNRAWANALARRGFAVFVPDVFPWGSRRPEMPVDAGDTRAAYADPTGEQVDTYNRWAGGVEPIIAKALMTAGMTFLGLTTHEDQRALTYLTSRPEVDASRLACGGLSGGGLRTIFLAGLDDRIASAFCLGFMPTLQGVAYSQAYHHTIMVFLPGMATSLDFPDVLSLRVPKPTLVLQCREDELFPLSCMEAADEVLREVYHRAGAPDNYHGKFVTGRHQFTPPMQDYVFDWLEAQVR